MLYKKLCFLVVLSVFSLLCPKLFCAHPKKAAAMANNQSWLFLQAAESGTLKKIKGSSSYLLTLKGVIPSMIAFADSPQRKASIRDVKQFIHNWKTFKGKGNYRDDPPNAALVVSKGSFENVFIVYLKSPKYNLKTNTLTYKITLIPLQDNRKHKGPKTAKSNPLPKKFQKAILFIDNSWSALGG